MLLSPTHRPFGSLGSTTSLLFPADAPLSSDASSRRVPAPRTPRPLPHKRRWHRRRAQRSRRTLPLPRLGWRRALPPPRQVPLRHRVDTRFSRWDLASPLSFSEPVVSGLSIDLINETINQRSAIRCVHGMKTTCNVYILPLA